MKTAHLIFYTVSQHWEPQLPHPPTGQHSQVLTLNLHKPQISISLNSVLPISRRMDKEAMVHIHNGILLTIKKNSFESGLMRWTKLEPIIQSEVSQKDKHQYSVLMHIYGI